MAVAFDAVGPSSAGTSATNTTTVSWSHTCTGTNRLLVVGVAVGVSPSGSVTTTATYGGTSMTSVGKIASGGSTAGYVQMFQLVAPATGANTVVVTGSTTIDTFSAGSVSFTGADQTTPLGTAVTASGNSSAPSVAVTGTTSGNMTVDAVCFGSSTGITSSGQTLRWKKNSNGNTGAGNGASATGAGNGGSVTMSYTTGSADFWGIVGVEVKAGSTVASSGATVSGTATIGPAGFVARPSGATVAASATVAAAGFAARASGAAVAATASLTTTGLPVHPSAASVVGTAAIAAATQTQSGAATRTATATITAAGTVGAVKTTFNRAGSPAAIRAQICGPGGVAKTPPRFINRAGTATQVS